MKLTIRKLMICVALLAINLAMVQTLVHGEEPRRPQSFFFFTSLGLLPLVDTVFIAVMLRKWKPYTRSATIVFIVVTIIVQCYPAGFIVYARTCYVPPVRYVCDNLGISGYSLAGLYVGILHVFVMYSGPSIAISLILATILHRFRRDRR